LELSSLFLIIAIVSILAVFVFAGIAVVNFTGKNKEKGSKSLKKSVLSLVVVVVSFIAFGVTSDQEEPKKVEVSGPAKEVVKKEPELTEDEKATVEPKKKEEKKADVKKDEIVKSEYDDETIKGWEDSLDRVIGDSEDFISKIELLEAGRYDVIHVYMKDSFLDLPDKLKEELINSWGGKIIGNTKSRLLGNDAKVNVYFKEFGGRDIATPNMLDKGWKLK